jgi:hypothetical protein
VSAVRSSITTGGAGLAIRGKQIPARGDRCGVLTPSTRFAYPHVVSYFRVVPRSQFQCFRRSFLKERGRSRPNLCVVLVGSAGFLVHAEREAARLNGDSSDRF